MQKFERARPLGSWKLGTAFAIFLLLIALAIAAFSQESDANTGLIQLRDPLDEPEFYCIDVPGFGANLNLNGPLQTHTCKSDADDEIFTYNFPEAGQFYMDAYDLCLEAGGIDSGAALVLDSCSDSSFQVFDYSDVGEIVLQAKAEELLCIAVADGDGTPTGGPSHLRRDLELRGCDDVDPMLKSWLLGVKYPN